jgi:hypothetical protein
MTGGAAADDVPPRLANLPGAHMAETAVTAEPLIRLGCFLGVLMAMTLWEALKPRRQQTIGRLRRWPNNIGLVVLDTLAVRLLFPLTGIGMAFLAQSKEWGLFNLLPVPAWLAVPAAVLLLGGAQACCCRGAWRAPSRRADLRGSAERHIAVQPQQHSAAAR